MNEPTNTNNGFDCVAWIIDNLAPKQVEAAEFIYDLMESQSGQCLPVVYQPFDARNDDHFADRGWALDYVKSLGLGCRPAPAGRVLDFGPGDGWPSLIIAPFSDEVVRDDSSPKRVEVCKENATRLGIENAQFTHVPAGKPLPFPDESFDAVAAASSIESTPDPQATLKELFRVLRPGGKLRMFYEALNRYRDGREREAWISGDGFEKAFIVIYDRRIDAEVVEQYRLSFDMSPAELRATLTQLGTSADYAGLNGPVLEELKPQVAACAKCVTKHPSGRTWKQWLLDTGFSSVAGTHAGGPSARRLLSNLKDEDRPQDIVDVDQMLAPYIHVVVTMPAPLGTDPLLTAVK